MENTVGLVRVRLYFLLLTLLTTKTTENGLVFHCLPLINNCIVPLLATNIHVLKNKNINLQFILLNHHLIMSRYLIYLSYIKL